MSQGNANSLDDASERKMSTSFDQHVGSNRQRLMSVLQENTEMIMKAKHDMPQVFRRKRSKSSELIPIEPLLTESSESEESEKTVSSR